MDGYEKLANAIIIQAAKDYRAALRRLRRKPGNKDAQNEKESIERFFRSDWFRALAIGILLAACIAVTSASMYMGEEPPFRECDDKV